MTMTITMMMMMEEEMNRKMEEEEKMWRFAGSTEKETEKSVACGKCRGEVGDSRWPQAPDSQPNHIFIPLSYAPMIFYCRLRVQVV